MAYQQWPYHGPPAPSPPAAVALAPPGTTQNHHNPNPEPNPNPIYHYQQQPQFSSYYYPPNPNPTYFSAAPVAGGQAPSPAPPSGYDASVYHYPLAAPATAPAGALDAADPVAYYYSADPDYSTSLVGPNLPRSSTFPSSASSKAGQKSRKNGTQVAQSVFCEVCKIECNTREVLMVHKLGKKHKKNLKKLQDSLKPKPAPVVNGPTEKAFVSEKDTVPGEQTKRKKAAATAGDLETKKRKLLEGGAAAGEVKVCAICNIAVNSQVVYDYHIMGQKHAAAVKKLQQNQGLQIGQ